MIQVKDVVKKYGKVKAIDNASFNVVDGSITCLLGINGVGKSTLLKAILGLIPIDKGSIFIDNKELDYSTYDDVAFIPDLCLFYPKMLISDVFEFMGIFYRNWNRDKALKMLKFFNLKLESKISALSKGNIARLKLVVGFSQESKYLIMDEPFSGMDIFSREDFILSIKSNFMNKGQTILLTTHEILEIQDIADYVILIDNGKVVRTFSIEEANRQGKTIIEMMRQVYNA